MYPRHHLRRCSSQTSLDVSTLMAFLLTSYVCITDHTCGVNEGNRQAILNGYKH